MPPRAYWTGNIKVSLVTFGVRIYNAVTDVERIRLNQVHKDCNARVRMPPTCPVHGQLDRSEIAKAYEFEKDKYVIIDQKELDAIKIRSEKTIEIERFVPAGSVDDIFFDSEYYVAPDGPIAEEPFRVFRAALDQTKTAAIGKVTFAGHERPLVLRGRDQGFVLTTLHTLQEVRPATPYFEEITNGKLNQEYLNLAVSLIKSKQGKFDPEEFHDRYQEALVALVKSKIAGQEPVIIQEEDIPATFNFAEALKQSLGGKGAEAAPKVKRGAKKPPARSEAAPGTAAASKAQRKRKQA